VALVGIALTLFFGVWSIVKGKLKAGSRFVKLFLVLLVLYTGQFFSTKWLGQPFLPPIAFQSSVTLMLVWLMFATFRDDE
jgi:hypothetical protein